MEIKVTRGTIAGGRHIDPGTVLKVPEEITKGEADLLLQLGKAVKVETAQAVKVETVQAEKPKEDAEAQAGKSEEPPEKKRPKKK